MRCEDKWKLRPFWELFEWYCRIQTTIEPIGNWFSSSDINRKIGEIRTKYELTINYRSCQWGDGVKLHIYAYYKYLRELSIGNFLTSFILRTFSQFIHTPKFKLNRFTFKCHKFSILQININTINKNETKSSSRGLQDSQFDPNFASVFEFLLCRINKNLAVMSAKKWMHTT